MWGQTAEPDLAKRACTPRRPGVWSNVLLDHLLTATRIAGPAQRFVEFMTIRYAFGPLDEGLRITPAHRGRGAREKVTPVCCKVAIIAPQLSSRNFRFDLWTMSHLTCRCCKSAQLDAPKFGRRCR